MQWMTLALLALRFIPSVPEFRHAVRLLKDHCQRHAFVFYNDIATRQHVFSYYFDVVNVRFGPAHVPGEVQSTCGLERTLGHTKEQSGTILKHLN
jgi:hypothetical protein